MKKMFLSASCIAVAATITLVACTKNDAAKTSNNNNNTVACTDSAYLMADSLFGCSPATASSYKAFYLFKKNKNILVAKGTFPDIDTIVNGGSYLINYDSIGKVGVCGAMLIKANLTCHTRL